MTLYVLMHLRTGNLFLGRRIMFIDRPEHTHGVYGIDLLRCDGWLVYAKPFVLFFNKKETDEMFENLGEL